MEVFASWERSESERPPEPAAAPVVTRLEGGTKLDAVIFDRDDWDRMPAAEAAELRGGAIADALRHHREHCAPFAAFCERRGFEAGELLAAEELADVPQFPSSVFKTVELRSVEPADVVRCFQSSGTTGAVSRIPRDELTLSRLSGSLRASAGIWSELTGDLTVDEDVSVVHLGPSRADAGDVWFGYVMSLIELEAHTAHLMRDGRIDLGEAAALLREKVRDFPRVLLVGAPALVAGLCHHVRHDPLRGGDRLNVVTGGGWKRRAQSAIDPEAFASLAVDAFGLADPALVRDVFNQVELNAAFVRCPAGRLHVPPWIEVIPRDLADGHPVGPGVDGVLSYLDPTAHSYPGFFVGEDVGCVATDECACGRTGVGVTILRRLEVTDHQGCGLQLQRRLDSGGGAPAVAA